MDGCDVRQLIERRLVSAERVAFVEGATGRTLTWADVARRAIVWRQMVGRLPGGRVGLLFADPLEMAAAVLSAISAGVAAVPLDPSSTPGELADQVERLGLAALVSDRPEDLTALTAGGLEIWSADQGRLRVYRSATDGGCRRPGRDGAALVLSSSGTTGTSKIVPLSEDQLLHTARAVVSHHQLTAEDCGYSPLPLFHINGLVVGVLSTLVAGARLVLDRRFSARSFWTVAGRNRVTWLNLVPAIITILGEAPAPPAEVATRIGFARSASAPLPAASRERFEAATGITVLETYGMTEAASQITANPRPAAERQAGSVGTPVGLELRVVDGTGRPVPPDVVGQVCIRGASVIREYWAPAGSRPAARPATGPDGWLVTGDLGRLDAGGFLYLVGRADDVINRGGEKVYPRQIEEVLLADPGVVAAAVVGRAHPTLGQEPVAFVVPSDGSDDADALVARLHDECVSSLSRFLRPAAIVVTARLPAGPTGKVRRGELRRSLAAHAA